MKKTLSTLLLSLFLLPTLALAVGLGSVRNYSFLNERLNAEIPILSIQQKSGLNVSLASNEEFTKRGITREALLNTLTLSTIEKNGRSYIKIGSANRITAPYLNFVLKLNTPEGDILREYAIFLDPRQSVSQSPKNQPTAKTFKPQPTAKTFKPQPAAKTFKPQPVAQNQTNKSRNIKGKIYGPIKEGETIWRIATNTRPNKSVPIDKFIDILKAVNPQAFNNGQLKKGTKLLIPSIKKASNSNVATKQEKNSSQKTVQKNVPNQGVGLTGIKGWVYGPIKSGETLWSISTKTRPSSTIPVDKFSKVLTQINPQAFNNGQLKKGAKLLIPKVKGFPSETEKKN